MTRSAVPPVASQTRDGCSVLGERVAGLCFGDLGTDVRVCAAQCVLDGLGVGIAAAGQPAVGAVRSVVLADGGRGTARLWGTSERAPARDAALVNGTAAHALDFDDVSPAMGGHPTVPVLPAALALAEELGTGGPELLTALVAGMEVEIRVGAALGTAHYRRGFHTTATAGTLGAAAAAARLLRLSADRTATALGIAATHAAGLKSMFGTMCKPLHAGKAAAAGILSARLAAAGFDSARGALEGEQGLLRTLSDAPDPAPLHTPFGDPWHVTGVLFKYHASCYLTHASIEAALAVREQGLDPATIDTTEILISPDHLGVCDIPEPRTGLEGKFSVRFATALALATGRTDESAFTDAGVAAPELSNLRERVVTVSSDRLDRYQARVTVRDRAGRTWRAEADAGTPSWTRSPVEQSARLAAKFDALVAPVLGPHRASALRERLLADPGDPPSAAELAALTGPGAAR